MASVIKASSAQRAADGSPLNLDDLDRRGQDQLHQARAAAAEIVAQAQHDAAEIRRRAAEAGRAEALELAAQLAQQSVAGQVASLLPALSQAVTEVEAAKSAWLAHWESAALRVATAIASRVVRRQVERSPDITLALVREALELSAGKDDVQLRMHPDDLATLGHQVGQLVGELTRLGQGKVVADPAICPGACRLETRYGAVDQQFAAQLERIESELRD